MAPKEKRYMECPTCYTLIAYLNGICPECGGSGVVEEKETVLMVLPPGKPDPKAGLKLF
jgi:DnaJ-class molecular chaperone